LQISSNGSEIPEALHATVGATDAPFQTSLEEAEKNLLTRALEKSGGNQTRAAVLLGITRDTLRYKMKKFNLH
jgi:DNA-binding protein Fis